jgi:hypothetical protein
LLWSAEAKALGFVPANQAGVDGFAGFAKDINPNSLVGVALHELTHALGRAPAGLPLSFGDIPDIFDLFRFDSANDTRLVDGDFGNAPPAYFSVDNGGTVLANYGETSDPGDFLNDSLTVNDPFDEFYVPGATFQSLTLTDLIQLDVLGFNTITFSWTSGASGDFASASNWTSGGTSPSTSAPTLTDNVVITQSGAYTVSSSDDYANRRGGGHSQQHGGGERRGARVAGRRDGQRIHDSVRRYLHHRLGRGLLRLWAGRRSRFHSRVRWRGGGHHAEQRHHGQPNAAGAAFTEPGTVMR